MPRRIIHPGTGFIEFVRTPEERALMDLQSENKELKQELSSIKKILQDKLGVELKEE